MLVWTQNPGLPPADLQQIALLRTGTARAVAAYVRRAADRLPEDHAARALADVVLEEASRRLSVPPEGTARCAQNRARLVRALYERLDRLVAVAPQAATAPRPTAGAPSRFPQLAGTPAGCAGSAAQNLLNRCSPWFATPRPAPRSG
ncbi:restriction endonuclease [Streptomyces sp. NPDC047014]|uniref:restriction endonuclease n=1 Tax=Streptomyces sp. NPDC047014 TaxID=3155736 RepID=UPI0033D057A3